ncbi:MAG: hypothetical protein LBQ13_04775 [Endomicrobium sp.]|jgi:hypothetical protein|nr:hypothetical protein [Endomicrobium sp.]
MKKTKFLLATVLYLSFFSVLQAQEVRSKVNEILANWILPVFAFICVGAAIVGIVKNYDLIVDSQGEGTSTKGWINVGKTVLYAFIASMAVSSVITVIASINLSI